MACTTRIVLNVFCVIGLLFSMQAIAQKKNDLQITYYYPKDSLKYEKDFPDQTYHINRENYGKTTMLIHVKSNAGWFDYVFKKKIKHSQKFEGQYVNVYGVLPDGTNGVVRKDYIAPYTETKHDLYAFVYLYDHGGFLEKVKFQDFGNVVYWPEFDYPNCFVADEDKNGSPEFYLTYKGFSDGLDPTAVKQIVYTIPTNSKGQQYTKAKAVHYIIKDSETSIEDYKDTFDASWKALPKAVQQRSLRIVKSL